MAGKETIVEVDGRRLRLTNLDKVLYPETGTTKADVIDYYSRVAEVMLPHCAGRPCTRKRWVNGVGTAEKPGQVFFTKNLDSGTPDWVVRVELPHSDHTTTYPLVNDRATLVWMAQMAALELHVPQWRVDSSGGRRNPDRIVFDLDPGPGIELPEVAGVALWVRDVLGGMGMETVPVTSGSKGIHVYAALDGTHTSDQIKDLAKELARSLEADHPDLVVSDMAKAKRTGRILIDWSQNHYNKTTVAPYSLRGRERPAVAVPRTWEELADGGLRHLTPDEVLDLVAERGDVMARLEGLAHAHDTFGDPDPSPDRLTTYRAKRDAARTPEPVPETVTPRTGGDPVFVIQEHHATRLHWDLRLEHEGVLVSWALPKGVPTDPKKNHLAVHTEDHPMEYLTFSGSIPKGEYGGGEMTIWDTGTYELEKWREGKEVIVTLTGSPGGGLERTTGGPTRLALIRTGRDGDEKNWLAHLMRPAHEAEADEKGTTAGRTTAARAAPGATEAGRTTTARASAARGTRAAAGPRTDTGGGAPLTPMLATAGTPADVRGGDWALEMKWDGMRALVDVDGGTVRMWSRSGREVTAGFPELADLAGHVRAERALLDGEIVALDATGRPSFSLLQPRMQAANGREIAAAARARPVRLMMFDLLEVDGESLVDKPYRVRRERLHEVVGAPDGALVQVPPAFDGDLDAAIEASRQWGLEGVVAKRVDSRYLPGRRSSSWLKIKHARTQDVVIGGWRPGQGGREGKVGSLLAGVFDDGDLVYVGRVGSGLREQEAADLVRDLAPLTRSDSPFSDVPALDARDAHWIEPVRVGEVEYGEWTPTGRLRHPRWRGWRPDRSPEDVVREA